ncbi:alpha/beta-hydrolase [Hymenopellis radicata]|nr:alpha/beta-hydrolase [Hymenopellis radicata]
MDHGVPAVKLKDLVDYWRNFYDWRNVEKKLNETFQMFEVNIEEEDEKLHVHFVHHRSKRADAIPLLFVHGWPGSFLEVEGLLSRLVDPEDPKAQAFHIVAPSIPGFAFSSPASRAGFTIKSIASVFKKLMVDILGYASFIAQGGDWGAGVVRSLAAEYPKICLGAHINFVQAFSPPSPTQNPLVFLGL